ncbi:MAG: hypothetical protein AAGF87_07725 [Bacteroidota bacterium]
MNSADQNWDRIGRRLEKYQPPVPSDLHFDQFQEQMTKGTDWFELLKSKLTVVLIILALSGVVGLAWVGSSTNSLSDDSLRSDAESLKMYLHSTNDPESRLSNSTPVRTLVIGESGESIEGIEPSIIKANSRAYAEGVYSESSAFGSNRYTNENTQATEQMSERAQKTKNKIDVLAASSRQETHSMLALPNTPLYGLSEWSLAVPEKQLVINTNSQKQPVRKRREILWSIALGHVWHLKTDPNGIDQTDEGVFVRLGYTIPFSSRFGLRAELGYRDHSWYWTPNDTQWLSYSESISISSPSGTTSVYRFGSSYSQFRSLSVGAELSTNLGQLTLGLGARYSYVYGRVSLNSSPKDDPLNPFNDFRPTLLRRHDLSLTGSLRLLVLNRLGIQVSGQLGLTDLSPDGLWEISKRETSSAVDLGLFYKF